MVVVPDYAVIREGGGQREGETCGPGIEKARLEKIGE